MQNRIREGGFIFTETKARKEFSCAACPIPIRRGEHYWKVEMGGGGVCWAINPDRIHLSRIEIDRYLEGKNGNQCENNQD